MTSASPWSAPVVRRSFNGGRREERVELLPRSRGDLAGFRVQVPDALKSHDRLFPGMGVTRVRPPAAAGVLAVCLPPLPELLFR